MREQERVEGQRVEQLESRRASLAADLAKVEAEIGVVVGKNASADLEPLFAAAAERVKKLSSALADVQCLIAGVPEAGMRTSSPVRPPGEVIADQILHFTAGHCL